jgi:hypothetical protein
MDTVVLTAKVARDAARYVARIEDLDLEGEGDSLEAAQDDLIQIMRAWIEAHDGSDTLGNVLAEAGYLGVDEETELQLEFTEPGAPPTGE